MKETREIDEYAKLGFHTVYVALINGKAYIYLLHKNSSRLVRFI